MIKTVSLTANQETEVILTGGCHCCIENRGNGTIYASKSADIVPDADGVTAIDKGNSKILRNIAQYKKSEDNSYDYYGKIYLLSDSDGKAEIQTANDLSSFRSRKKGGEQGTVVKIDDVQSDKESINLVTLNSEIDSILSGDKFEIKNLLYGISNNWSEVSTLPIVLGCGSAVILNNEIHTLRDLNHYKYDGKSWSSVSTLPYRFNGNSAVVLNNEIHILGSVGGYYNHYKYDGNSWSSVSTLPFVFSYSSAVVLNNEIHILGGGTGDSDTPDNKHYKYDGNSWSSVSTLPFKFYNGSAVVLNNEIHILGGNFNRTKHYKYDGNSWSSVSTLPFEFYNGARAVVFNNEIHILGNSLLSDGEYKHYKYDGNSWSSVSTLPYTFYKGCVVVYNNEIHIMSDDFNNDDYYKHYSIKSYLTTQYFTGTQLLEYISLQITNANGNFYAETT